MDPLQPIIRPWDRPFRQQLRVSAVQAPETTPPPISARAARCACNAFRSTCRLCDKKLTVALDRETLEAVLVDVICVHGAERRVKTFGVRSRHVRRVLGKLLLIVPPKLKVSV